MSWAVWTTITKTRILRNNANLLLTVSVAKKPKIKMSSCRVSGKSLLPSSQIPSFHCLLVVERTKELSGVFFHKDTEPIHKGFALLTWCFPKASKYYIGTVLGFQHTSLREAQSDSMPFYYLYFTDKEAKAQRN